MDWLRIDDRAINLAAAQMVDYYGPCGVVEDDRLTIDYGEAAGGKLVMTGEDARAAWLAIAAACPNRAAEAGATGLPADSARARVVWATGRLAGLLATHAAVAAPTLRPVLVQLRAALDDWGLPARPGPGEGEGRGQP